MVWMIYSTHGWVDVLFPVYDGMESVVWVGGVLDNPLGAVRFDEGVGTLDHISGPHFGLALDVACVGVVDSVFELVFWVSVHVVDDLLGGDGSVVDWSGVDNWSGVDYWSGHGYWSGWED